MAAAAAEVTDVRQEEVDVCSVCTDPTTRDPRLLDCGHHFCKRCLDKLVVENSITCPTCRYITQVNTGVEGLAWYRTTNPFTDKVTLATKGSESKEETVSHIMCDNCDADKKEATKTCLKCAFNFCADCGIKHGHLEESLGHKLYPISAYMFCELHTNTFITVACISCDVVCCTRCAIRDHNAHKIHQISKAGLKVRERLQVLKDELTKAKEDERISQNIATILQEAKEVRETFHNSIKGIKSVLEELTAKVTKVCEAVNTKMTATIKTLEMMNSDIGDYMISKTSLRELLTYLIESASSPEVVIREKELPKYDKTTYKQVIRVPEVEIAVVKETLSQIKANLDRCQQDLDIAFTKHSVCGPQYDTTPLSNLKMKTTIQAGADSWGLAVDSGRERLVVRRNDVTAPISIYDFQGQRLQVLGQGVEGITHADRQGVAIDTKRNLYVLPVNNGSLVTMDTDGNVKDKIKVTKTNYLEGIAYTKDFYVTCRGYDGKNEMHLVNPENKQKVATFSPNTTFSRPYNVSSGMCSITGEPQLVFITSNHGSECIKLMDSSGRLLHTYGKEGKSGQGEGELYYPWALCIGPGGRIIVCDQSNHRVVVFWQEDGKDRWEQLLIKANLGGKMNPRHITYDPVSRRLFVGFNDGTIYIYQ